MSSMTIRTLMKVAPHLPHHHTILLRGDHGVGKSAMGKRLRRVVAASLGLSLSDYEYIDRRLSQMSEGDLLGLPSVADESTRFNPPDWYKRACLKPCFLMLDELNRATPEVMQAAFQVVLDYELGGWKLHPLTRVMSAVNTGAAYVVNDIDPALLDRFFVVDLTPDKQDWLDWAREKCDSEDPTVTAIKKLNGGYNIPRIVVDFHSTSAQDWLDQPKDTEPGTKSVSRRSWERCADALCLAGVINDPSAEEFYAICQGYLGVEAAIKFTGYAKSYKFQVTGKDVIEEYDLVKDKVVGPTINRDHILDTIDKVATYVLSLEELNDKQGQNFGKFLGDAPDELKMALWFKVAAGGVDKLALIKSIHKHCAKTVLDVFGVPMGDAGIGVIPKIPGIYTSEKRDT